MYGKGKWCPVCAFPSPLLYRNGSQRSVVTSVTTDQEDILPVITVNIGGENNLYKRGNVLLDSGVQLSLIRQETAESLGLEGDNISITLTKVGGEDEEIRKKAYKVQFSPPDNNKRFFVKAVGIPTISDDIAGI